MNDEANRGQFMEVKAVAKYIRVSPEKVRKVMGLIQNTQADEAMRILGFVRSENARRVKKVLQSAMSNARNNLELDSKTLYVKKALVDKGPAFKRVKPRARGRADLIRKRTSHITIVLEG